MPSKTTKIFYNSIVATNRCVATIFVATKEEVVMVIQLRVEDELGRAFKERCEVNHVSVSSCIRSFMKEFTENSSSAEKKISVKREVSATPKVDQILKEYPKKLDEDVEEPKIASDKKTRFKGKTSEEVRMLLSKMQGK